jgi:ABC-type branched-subunit amino acid transport system ATPase component
MSPAAAIQAIGIARRFGGVQALEGVSLTIPAGEIRGIIGPNGAGKTTLLNVLSGLMEPTQGRIHCFGEDVTNWAAHRIARRARIVRTFQTVRLFPTMNVFENVLVAADAQEPAPEERLLGRRRRARGTALERTTRIMDELGLATIRDRRVDQLSYGLRRRVEMARTLVMQPRVLLLDEPAAGLNDAERAGLGSLLLEARERDITIVLVEHQMDLVSRVCDALTVLDFGKVICEGPPERVVEDDRVLEAYLGAPGGKL